MSSTSHEAERKTGPEMRHPLWCGRRVVECTGDRHRSVAVRVELDEYAGCAVRAYLRGNSTRVFVELEFVSKGAIDAAAAAWERLEMAAGEDANATRDHETDGLPRISAEAVQALVYSQGNGSGTRNGADEPTTDTGTGEPGDGDAREPEESAGTAIGDPAQVNPLDPVYVDDPHGHSVSVEQAEILGGLLQYLVRAAQGGDVEALRAGARLT